MIERTPLLLFTIFGGFFAAAKFLESEMVRQLIVTAEREIIRKLPGEPYGNYLDNLNLKEENDHLKRQVADLEARLGTPSVTTNTVKVDPVEAVSVPDPVPKLKTKRQSRELMVEAGDSLYAISQKIYGNSSYIDAIFQANQYFKK